MQEVVFVEQYLEYPACRLKSEGSFSSEQASSQD